MDVKQKSITVVIVVPEAKKEENTFENFSYLPIEKKVVITSVFKISESDEPKKFSAPINESDLIRIGFVGSIIIKKLMNNIPGIINIGIGPEGLEVFFKEDSRKFIKVIDSSLKEVVPMFFL